MRQTIPEYSRFDGEASEPDKASESLEASHRDIAGLSREVRSAPAHHPAQTISEFSASAGTVKHLHKQNSGT